MKKIQLSKEQMAAAFLEYLEKIFRLPEIAGASVRDVIIDHDTMQEAGRRAFAAGYHDCCSDVDLSVKVRLPKSGSVTSEAYMKRIDRFGVNEDTALGWFFVPDNHMYRIVFKDGMRYDLGFEFVYTEDEALFLGESPEDEENTNWPKADINRFWFVQIQALGKLYRKDYLIAAHLANMDCNDTLVMQMVLRDLKYATNHHLYGYAEEAEYTKDLGRCPYKTGDESFDRIAAMLYAAALSYDRLAKCFYPGYQDRSEVFFAIWEGYEACRVNGE